MQPKAKKIIATFAGVVGFASAIVGLWPYIFPPKPPQEMHLVPIDTPNIEYRKRTESVVDGYIKANEIIIDGISLLLQNNSFLLANKITFLNGAEVRGEEISITSTVISGGKITATSGRNGGAVFLATALANNVEVRADGLPGVDGVKGTNGGNGQAGANGRDGDCRGFGKWKSPHAGAAGQNGSPGTNGTDGQNGGNGGSITIITAYDLVIRPTANGSKGGSGGEGGKGGKGGAGGRGGSGCTGLGGSSSSKPNGADGRDGRDGSNGKNGKSGAPGIVSVKLIDFDDVVKAVERQGHSRESLLLELRKIQPNKI